MAGDLTLPMTRSATRTLVSALIALAGCTSARSSLDAGDAFALDVVDAVSTVDTGTDTPGLPDVPVATACTVALPTLATGHLTVDGTRLRDALGRVVLLRGVNAGGRSKFAPFMPFEFTDEASFALQLTALMTTFDAWGIDVVRLPFLWDAMEPTQGTWDEAYLTHYRALLDAAWAHGIRVVIDFHQDVYTGAFCGDGFPAWTLGPLLHGAPHHDCTTWYQPYFDPHSTVAQAFDRLWANTDGIADAMQRAWRELATRFGTHPAVAGFEVINEPGSGSMDATAFEQTTLPPFVMRMAAAITAVAPDAVVFQGGTSSDTLNGTPSFVPPTLAAFVYAPHFYDPLVITGSPYLDAVGSRTRLASVLQGGIMRNEPVFVGEFGGSFDSPDLGRFVRDTFDALDRTLTHGAVWEASISGDFWNGEHLDVLQPDGTERVSIANEISRGYPRAVDGTITSLRWDAVAHTFALSVSAGGGRPSEVFIPARHVGAAPRIGLDHGCVSWDPTSGRLNVQPSAPIWTLTVQP